MNVVDFLKLLVKRHQRLGSSTANIIVLSLVVINLRERSDRACIVKLSQRPGSDFPEFVSLILELGQERQHRLTVLYFAERLGCIPTVVVLRAVQCLY